MRRMLATLGLALVALMLAPERAPAADVFLRADLGDVFLGIDTRDHRFRGGHKFNRHPSFSERKFHGRHDRSGWRPRAPREPLLFGSGPVNDVARDQRRRELDAERRFDQFLLDRRHFGRDRHKFERKFEDDVLLPHGHPFKHGIGHDVFLERDRVFFDHETFLWPGGYVDDRPYDGFAEEEDTAAAPPPPAEPPAPAAAEPPDLRGPDRFFARGLHGGFTPVIGAPLPPGRPHVALDWQDYDLPRPPAGQGYARIDGYVVLIETDTRVVRQVILPAAG